MKEVAERLRSLRESVKLSQVKMAEIVGVKQSSLNRYELNQASPTFETLTRYADYFDVSMDYIFGRTDNPQGKLYEYKPKIQQNDPQMQKFVEMCFDPTSPMNARLKETLLQMLGEAKQRMLLSTPATPAIARPSNLLRDSSIPAMSMQKTTAILLFGSTSTVPRAEPPTVAPSSSG